jgi:hypothetical protein
MRFSGLGKENGKAFDMLVISTSDRYETVEGYESYNNVYGWFGMITMVDGANGVDAGMDLKFQIVEAGTETPMVLSKFFTTFFDIDTGDNGFDTDYGSSFGDASGSRELLTASGFDNYILGPDSELKITQGNDGRTNFEAMVYGNGDDNPLDPFKLNVQQQNRAVTLQFSNTDHFDIKFDVKEGPAEGREMFFSGLSTLATIACPATLEIQSVKQQSFAPQSIPNVEDCRPPRHCKKLPRLWD